MDGRGSESGARRVPAIVRSCVGDTRRALLGVRVARRVCCSVCFASVRVLLGVLCALVRCACCSASGAYLHMACLACVSVSNAR